MSPISNIDATAYPLGRPNIDTDIIIAAEWMKTITREGLGKGAFESIRAEPGNVFDDPRYHGAAILLAGANYGCGSSREHAAWAMLDMGIKAVIAPSFSDIFAGNAFKNGILTVALPQAEVDHLLAVAADGPIHIDLARQTVEAGAGNLFRFEIDPFRKTCLLGGLDEISLTLEDDSEISRFEAVASHERPWTT